MISIEPVGSDTAFRARDEVEVWCRWRLDAASSLEARLVWRVTGWGDRDERVVETQSVATDASHGDRRLRFRLPDGPYSMKGQIFGIEWVVEIQAGQDVARWPFVVGHEGRLVQLGEAAKEIDVFW
jgi:hypothetical protein